MPKTVQEIEALVKAKKFDDLDSDELQVMKEEIHRLYMIMLEIEEVMCVRYQAGYVSDESQEI